MCKSRKKSHFSLLAIVVINYRGSVQNDSIYMGVGLYNLM